MKTDSLPNLLCNIDTGHCSPAPETGVEAISLPGQTKVRMIYYTDPICSSCWAIEPRLKKFKLEYGSYFNIEYRMGGLLPGWKGFADVKNGIQGPASVAPHWDEVGEKTGMSIDGDLWLEDPLDSSFPPSIAFKAMQKQGQGLAIDFLRHIREMVFLQKKNISREKHLLAAVDMVGGNPDQFLRDYHDPETKKAFDRERREGKKMGVRGFPTFIFIGEDGQGFRMTGGTTYNNYVLALEKACGQPLQAKSIKHSEADLLKTYGFLAEAELAFVLGKEEKELREGLKALAEQGKAREEKQKFASFWRWTA